MTVCRISSAGKRLARTAGAGVTLQILLLLAICVGVFVPLAAQGQTRTFTAEQYAADFDWLWAFVDQTYVYFDPELHDWASVPSRHRAHVGASTSTQEFVTRLEGVIDELRDPHAHLNTHTPSSRPLVPSGTDIWAEWAGARALITEVREGSPAHSADLRPGDEVLEVNGRPIAEAVEELLGGSLKKRPPEVWDWGLRALLAGTKNADRKLLVRSEGKQRPISLAPLSSRPTDEGAALVEHRRLPANIGYIRLRNTLGDARLIAAFDSALSDLRDADALVLDLRDTPSGGNTTVARGIMGRLISVPMPYQMHVIPAATADAGVERRWVEYVVPRDDCNYARPLIVLVSHWTGSMGEGMAIGMDGMERATVVGTRMAGLKGATRSAKLPQTGITFTLPAERLYHVNGTPREAFVPGRHVNLLEHRGKGDPILEAGLKVLRSEKNRGGSGSSVSSCEQQVRVLPP